MKPIAEAVAAERRRQRELVSTGEVPHDVFDHLLPYGPKLAVLVEEVGEAAKAALEGAPAEELREELVQVAAVAESWADSLTVPDPLPGPRTRVNPREEGNI